MSLTKRPMTEKRIAASRANGRRSQGGRTREGRARAAAASASHVINHVINQAELVGLGQQPIEKAGGDGGARTRDLMRAK